MKIRMRILSLILMVLIMLLPGLVFASIHMESKNITAQAQFTEKIKGHGQGLVIISDTNAMNMTISLQVSINEGTTWIDTGDTWTSEAADALESGHELYYRLGVKTGNFTGGTATIYLIFDQN